MKIINTINQNPFNNNNKLFEKQVEKNLNHKDSNNKLSQTDFIQSENKKIAVKATIQENLRAKVSEISNGEKGKEFLNYTKNKILSQPRENLAAQSANLSQEKAAQLLS